MSQIYKTISSSPSVPIQFTADDGTMAVPAANNLNVFSQDTTVNNDNGIQTTVIPNGSANLFIELTNRLQSTGTTVGATTATVITFSLGATPASYMFEFNITGFDTVTPTATGYWFIATARTTGAAATVVGTNEDFLEDAALATSDVDMIAVGNTVTLVVTGVAGVTLHWNVVGYYVRAI